MMQELLGEICLVTFGWLLGMTAIGCRQMMSRE